MFSCCVLQVQSVAKGEVANLFQPAPAQSAVSQASEAKFADDPSTAGPDRVPLQPMNVVDPNQVIDLTEDDVPVKRVKVTESQHHVQGI